mgnify:FL=1
MSSSSVAEEVAANYQSVLERVEKAADGRTVRLVAVSKTKPIEMLESAYTAGCRIFGENYMQELVEKVEKLDKPDIQWHFIGGLKSNKCKALVDAVAPNVDKLMVETVASTKLANKLNSAVSKMETEERLKVFVQVNTSGSKNGVEPGDECVDLCR